MNKNDNNLNSEKTEDKLKHFTSILPSLLFLPVLIFTVYLFWPGLDGRFILDDEPNLSNLTILNSYNESDVHSQNYTKRFWLFVTEGVSSTIGRPISLLTFALQSHNWPSNPHAFKYVNLMIHLINGCLVYLIIIQLAIAFKIEGKSLAWLALTTAALWLIHPIHTGTILYVVQRMTELSALFMLIAIFLYLKGRQQINVKEKDGFGLTLMTTGVVSGLICGILSKENAILLPLYIIVIEYTCLQDYRKPNNWEHWRNLFLLLPIFLFIAYLYIKYDSIIAGSYGSRNFTLVERLMTESRVVLDYASKILIPVQSKYGLFHDDYEISRSLIAPLTTLPSILILIASFLSAMIWRRRYPILSFAILWFLVGHALESTIIPLELYFDHRNYLPSMSLIFALSYLFILAITHTSKKILKKTLGVLLLGYVSLTSYLTYSESTIWSNPHLQSLVWAKDHPTSLRARINTANTYLELGHTDKTREVLNSLQLEYPKMTSTYAYQLYLNCLTDDKSYQLRQKDFVYLTNTDYDITTISVIRSIIDSDAQNVCDVETIDLTIRFIKAILSNNNFKSQYGDFHFLLARIYQYKGLLDSAMKQLDLSLKLKPDIYVAMNQAQMLASAGLYDDALKSLDIAGTIIRGSKLKENLFTPVLNEWRVNIIKDKIIFTHQQSREDNKSEP